VENWTIVVGCAKILTPWGRFVPGGAPGLQIQWKAWSTCLRWVRFPHAPAKKISARAIKILARVFCFMAGNITKAFFMSRIVF